MNPADLPAAIHRVGRLPNPFAWPDWAYAEPDGTFGNRFDDPRGTYRVLYAATEREGAFIETLARFRPDPAVFAALDAIEGESDERPTGSAYRRSPSSRFPGCRLRRRSGSIICLRGPSNPQISPTDPA